MDSNSGRYKGMLRLVEMRYGNGTTKWRVEKRNPGLGYDWMLASTKLYYSKAEAMEAADSIFMGIVVAEIPHEE